MSAPEQSIAVGMGSGSGDTSVVMAAAREAVTRQARLVVVHVAASDEEIAVVVRRRIGTAVAAARAAYPDLDVSVDMISGNPVTELLARPCDLLVVGHRPRPRRRRAGPSVAIGVTDRATVPVLVWPSGADPQGSARAAEGGVLVGIDGRHDDAVLDFAFDEAAARHVPVVAEHVWSDPADSPSTPHRPDGRRSTATTSEKDARHLLRRAIGRRSGGIPACGVARRSLDVAIALNAAARSADLTVIGAHRGHDSAGAVRHALIQRGACPVAVVPIPTVG